MASKRVLALHTEVDGVIHAPGPIDDAVAKRITNDAVFAEDVSETDEPDGSGGGSDGPQPPPRGGPGSGIEAWSEFAGTINVPTHTEDGTALTRDELIAAVEAKLAAEV